MIKAGTGKDTLGVLLVPNGSMKDEYQYLLKKEKI